MLLAGWECADQSPGSSNQSKDGRHSVVTGPYFKASFFAISQMNHNELIGATRQSAEQPDSLHLLGLPPLLSARQSIVESSTPVAVCQSCSPARPGCSRSFCRLEAVTAPSAGPDTWQPGQDLGCFKHVPARVLAPALPLFTHFTWQVQPASCCQTHCIHIRKTK